MDIMRSVEWFIVIAINLPCEWLPMKFCMEEGVEEGVELQSVRKKVLNSSLSRWYEVNWLEIGINYHGEGENHKW